MKQIGIFIEPTGSLARTICPLKAEVERRMPGQTYCAHPPHSTLIVGAFEPPDRWQQELAAALATVKPCRVHTDGFTIFYDDAPAGGGHTVAFKIAATPELFALQASVAEVLKRHRRPGAAKPPAPLLEREPFRSSVAKYGFPFVGPQWIPHFTIASLKVAKDAPLLREISAGAARHEFLLDRVSVWEIGGDSHTKLFELPLGGGTN